ncbi:MAG: glycoside hydrolase family 76 protein [Acidobacteriaceae bacterium]
MLRSPRLYIVISIAALCASAYAQTAPASKTPPPAQIQKQTLSGIDKLQTWYTQSSGLYQTTGWWNSANALTMLADYSLVAHTGSYTSVFANSFQQAQKTNSGFLNNYYDDEGWWALAWIGAYDLTHTQQYLDMASSIFTDMSGGWDATCGGGIWWSKDKTYKNAIANELFLSVAAHLANRVAPADRANYLAWANKEWTWFQQSGMINSQNLINDGLNLTTCKNNGQNTWTYNQGVVLGGLVELNRAQHSPQLLETARTIADAALTHLTDSNGVLHDTCEPNCGADGVQFKGIFARNLMALNVVVSNQRYATFAVTNAESVWNQSRDAGNAFGQVWSGPFDAENAGSQSSALDAFVAAYAAALEQKH